MNDQKAITMYYFIFLATALWIWMIIKVLYSHQVNRQVLRWSWLFLLLIFPIIGPLIYHSLERKNRLSRRKSFLGGYQRRLYTDNSTKA
ncbi:PLDc N-terminal domain-containing protein [Penaeicola halotolerans]|uniref:PLDc N-terminal domain-containing protein n=1 Tax=Penaeicola halotolerans TaxID=2793196 RepID=UPI001CF8D690|nr:PLD nuclease N-terminal domain-containing protein [Penaeicola halotolerans]